MTCFSWQDSYNLNIKKIDDQHQRLVEFINRLDRSLPQGLVNREVGKVLIALVDYAQHHFSEEEQLMKEAGYPGLEKHKQLHLELLHRIAVKLQNLKRGNNITVPELTNFIKQWVIDHIIKEDRLFGEYMSNKQIPEKSPPGEKPQEKQPVQG
jgi:hemerythrin